MYAEIDRFMDYLLSERNASRMTVKSYNDDLVQFAAFLAGLEDEEFQTQKGDSDLAAGEITPELIRAFVESCYDRSLKKSSISRKIACLKSFFTYLYNERIIDRNPAAEVSFPRREKPLPRFLYNGEVERILDFPVESFPDFRDRAILETFYATGARVSELAVAEYVDLDLNARSLRVLGKGARERVVFLTDDAVKRIREYLAERRKLFGSLDGPLFVNARGGRLSARGIFGIVDKGLHRVLQLQPVCAFERREQAHELVQESAALAIHDPGELAKSLSSIATSLRELLPELAEAIAIHGKDGHLANQCLRNIGQGLTSILRDLLQ